MNKRRSKLCNLKKWSSLHGWWMKSVTSTI